MLLSNICYTQKFCIGVLWKPESVPAFTGSLFGQFWYILLSRDFGFIWL